MEWYEKLKSARKRVNLSIRNVEKLTGISNAYISQIENGQIVEPSFFKLHKILNLYGLSHTEILDQCDTISKISELHDQLDFVKNKNHDLIKVLKNHDKQLIKWVKNHYWDSLEKDKDLILRHLRTFVGDVVYEDAAET